jgi:PAT family beta-lactamase induction signal transducer AmpG
MFLLTFLFAAIMQGKMAVLFLVENRSSGGLGFSPQEFGFVMGTVGVLGVTIGVVAGNKLVRRLGVGPLLVPMGVVLALPSIVYTLLSYWQPSEMWVVSLSVLIEQLAYGLGLSAYLAYQTSLPNKKLAKSLMAVSMMAACALSGLLQVQMGYNSFFITTLSLSVVTLISVCLVRKYSGSESFV